MTWTAAQGEDNGNMAGQVRLRVLLNGDLNTRVRQRKEYAGSTAETLQQQKKTGWRLEAPEFMVKTGDQGVDISGPAILRSLTFRGEDY